VLPTDKGLDSDDALILQVERRLIEQEELLRLDGGGHVEL
jgi:hypothetical protein